MLSYPPTSPTDLSASKGPQILAAVATTYVLATIAVILRFVSRRISKAQLWWDDWLIIIALVNVIFAPSPAEADWFLAPIHGHDYSCSLRQVPPIPNVCVEC